MSKHIDANKFWEARISPGVLCWVKASGRKLILAKTGDPINSEIVQKILLKNGTLDLQNHSHPLLINEGAELMEELKNASFEYQKIESSRKITSYFHRWLWNSSNEGAIIDLILLGENSFYNIPQDIENQLISGSLEIYKRSLLVGPLNVVLACALGVTSFKILQDFYHCPFFNDLSLLKKGLMSSDIDALESSRSTKVNLKEIYTGHNTDQTSFGDHSEKSVQMMGPLERQIFNSDIFEHYIGIHEELGDGSGQPRGISQNELGDLEKMIILTKQLISFKQIDFESIHCDRYLKNLMDSPNVDGRMRKLITDTFGSLNRFENEEVAS